MAARTIGPVTAGSTMGAAGACLLLGVGNRLGLDVTVDEAWALVIIMTGLGGYLVKPRGKHE